jgi:hypothetical protein
MNEYPTSDSGAAAEKQGAKPQPVMIIVHNEDTGGRPIQLKGENTETIQTFIDRLYDALRTARKADDRLRCGGSGVNVFSFAALTVADFQRQQCAAHEWVFAGATGGAVCSRRR